MEHINIIGTLYDNSIDHTVAHASLVYDDTFKKKQNVINFELRRDVNIALNNTSGLTILNKWVFGGTFPIKFNTDVAKALNQVLEDVVLVQETIESVQTDIQSLRNSINNINIPQPSETTHFVFMTQSLYDELEEYDQDTLYFITLDTGLGIFPITLT